MASQTVTLEKLEENIISNAKKSTEYRKRLLDDPKGLIEGQIGQPLPSEFKVTVLQETPTQAYIVLPYEAPKSGSELSDEDLESVAGGKSKMGNVTCSSGNGTGLQQTTVVDIEASL
jgi:hypothetical protein